jgi:hypothetical protein
MTACVDDCGSEDRRGAMCVQPKVAAAADRAAVIRRSSATLPIFSIGTTLWLLRLLLPGRSQDAEGGGEVEGGVWLHAGGQRAERAGTDGRGGP